MRLSTSLRLNAQKGLVTPYDPTLTLSLQFAARQAYVSDFGPLPTFTNATTTARTYVGSDGLLKTATINVPRIEFDTVTRQCLGLLIEEQRTNLASWSQDVTTWQKGGTGATNNSTTSPDGSATAALYYESATNTQHYGYNSPLASVTSGTTYTASMFFKKGSGATAPDWINCGWLGAGFGARSVAFNVSTGAFGVSQGAGWSYTSKQYPNGWWRVTMTAAATATGSHGTFYFAFTSNVNSFGTPTYPGQTTSDIFIWGAQFEAGSLASSYIPTTTTSLVRSADVCSITGAAFTGFYNQTEGAVALKYVRPTTANCTALAIDDGTVNERMISILSSGVERFGVVDGANVVNLDRTAGAINTVIGHAYRYKNLDFAFSANGSAVVTSITQTVPTPTQIQLGYRQSANYLNGHIHTIQYFNAIKTNAQLQTLSTP